MIVSGISLKQSGAKDLSALSASMLDMEKAELLTILDARVADMMSRQQPEPCSRI